MTPDQIVALHHIYDWVGLVALIAVGLRVVGELTEWLIDLASAKVVQAKPRTVVQFPRRQS